MMLRLIQFDLKIHFSEQLKLHMGGGIQVSLLNQNPFWHRWMKPFSFKRVPLNTQDMQYG